MKKAAWVAAQYTKFEDERSRPAAELIARIPMASPVRIVDLGCGPGNSTELLIQRFPEAEVVGLDSSPSMLAAARTRLPETRFIEADVAEWEPEAGVDLLFANASLQWVPGHLPLIKRLLARLTGGGALAFQVPDNLAEPTHTLMRSVALGGPWKARFVEPVEREAIPPPAIYYDLLKPHARTVDIWSTIYNHVLAGPEAILDWVLGTGLRPYLARLDEAERPAFLAEYTAGLAKAYPPLVDGRVLLRFPRLFVVAVRD